MKAPSVSSDVGGVFQLASLRRPFASAFRKRCAMPVWKEILVDLTGYAGFLVIARFNRSADGRQAEMPARPRGVS
jgi:hypothetical protein